MEVVILRYKLIIPILHVFSPNAMNIILSKSLYYYFKGSRLLSDLTKTISEGSRNRERNARFRASLRPYADFSNYSDLLQVSANLKSIQTNTAMQPDILGGNTRSTLAKYGKPDFIFIEKKLKIFLYARVYNDMSIRYEIHFYDDKIFSVHYIYKSLDEDDKNHIIQTITDNYVSRGIDEMDIYNSKIIDKNNDIVFFDEFPNGLSVIYLSNEKSDWVTGITKESNAVKSIDLN